MSVAIPKKFLEKALSLGISHIELHFSGGNDEAYLNVRFQFSEKDEIPNSKMRVLEQFEHEVEEWGYDAFSYSGAGDGNDYGDDYVYDLNAKTVTHSEWYTARQEGDCDECDFEIEGEDE